MSSPEMCCAILLFAFLFFLLYTIQESLAIEEEEEDFVTTKAFGTDAESRDAVNKRVFKKKNCRCWIGWRYNEGRKFIDFGVIAKYRPFSTGKQGRCSAECSRTCAPKLLQKDELCQRIGTNYHYKQHRVGCFSKVGRYDTTNKLWDFDGSPHRLCCKRYIKSCASSYGYGYYYNSALKLCVKDLKCAKGCIPGVPNGHRTPPVCCYGYKLYSCQYPKYGTKSVHC